MGKLSRRRFLQLGMGASGAMVFRQLFEPRLLMAQSSGAAQGKNLIVFNLLGGLDGLAAFPFSSGSLVNVVNNELRPNLGVAPGSVISIGGQAGISNPIGLHPSFAALHAVAGSRMKLIQGYGIPGDPGRSHDTCQILMSLGSTSITSGDMVGFMARVMDSQDWDTFQYWAMAQTNASDTNTAKNAPVTVGDLNDLDYAELGWERDVDRDFALQLQASLLELQTPRTSVGDNLLSSTSQMHQTVAVVRQDIAGQAVGNNSAGDYSDNQVGRRLRDTARVLRAKATNNNLSFSNKDMLFLLAQDGYDTHSDQDNPNNPQSNLAGLLTTLSENLAVFYRDLELFGILEDTLIVLYSEFGRTNYQNGGGSQEAIGTDHGHGSNTLVVGGPVSEGVIGSAPSANALRDLNYNALYPSVDFRDIFSDALAWMGIDPTDIFDDPNYTRTALGLVS